LKIYSVAWKIYMKTELMNKPDSPTTVVSIASMFGKALDNYGLDKYAIAKQVGINIQVAYKPNDRVTQ